LKRIPNNLAEALEVIDELEEEIRQLKEELHPSVSPLHIYRLRAYGMTGQIAHCAFALYAAKGRIISKHTLQTQRFHERTNASNRPPPDLDKGAEVMIHKVRKILGMDAIDTVVSYGYLMTDKGRAIMEQILAGTYKAKEIDE
jgi:hypothetical protein